MKFSVKIIMLFILLAFCGIIPKETKAAKIYFNPAEVDVKEKDGIQVKIFIDTRQKTINALKMTVKYPADLIKFVQKSEKDSIISLWVEPPKENDSGEISFSGLIPGGFEGKNGLIGTFVFEAEQKGSGKIKISDFEVLLNDKKGTELSTVADEMNFSVGLASESEMDSGAAVIIDNEPPEDFNAEIVKEDELFDEKWSLVFETQDRISGVSHYEIQETKNGKISEEGWKIVERGPYLLDDQKLNSYVYIKAVDDSGNNRIVVLSPKNISNIIIYSIVFILAIVIIIFKLIKSKFLIKINS